MGEPDDDGIVSPYIIEPRNIAWTLAVTVPLGLVLALAQLPGGVFLLGFSAVFLLVFGGGGLYVRRVAVRDGMWQPEAQRRTQARGRR